MENMVYLLAVVVFLAILIPFVFYLFTLQRTLEAIAIESRKMAPGHVWFLFIPLFNIVWQFIMTARIADSIRDECIRLQVPLTENRPTFTLGLVMSILYIVSIPMNNLSATPVLGGLCSLAALVCWIVYWVKVNNYRKLIIDNGDNFLLDIERETASLQ
jgi:hypothetical protein